MRIRLNPLHWFLLSLILASGVVAADRQCGDGLWEVDPCEYCGQDAVAEVGVPEMNHDCTTNIVDFGYFVLDYGLSGPGLSGDFDGNLEVNLGDFGYFAAHYIPNYGAPIADCEPCDVHADSCRGTLRMTFSVDPEDDADYIEIEPFEPVLAQFVVEDCPNTAAVMYAFEASPNIQVAGSYDYSDLVTEAGVGIVIPDESATFIGGVEFYATDSQPGWIRFTHTDYPAWDLAWAQIDPGRRMGFARIAHAGINGAPPPDSIGCEVEPEPGCGDGYWTYRPCEFCGQDAYAVTGQPEMNHDCWVNLIDLALFQREFLLAGEGLSADFNGSQMVDLADFAIFVLGYGHDVPDCDPCGVELPGCGGTVRIGFEADLRDVDRIDLEPYQPAMAYVVAEGCDSLSAANFTIYMSDNLSVSNVQFNTYNVIGEQAAPYYPPFGSEPSLLASVGFYVTDDQPAYMGVRGGDDSNLWSLHWVQIPPIRKMAFDVIAFGGINSDPPPDASGCLIGDVADRPDGASPVRIRMSPNPAARDVRIAFEQPANGWVRAVACDPAGRIVRVLHDGLLDGGPCSFRWDGRSDNGSLVPSGAYFIRLSGENVGGSSRLIWLR